MPHDSPPPRVHIRGSDEGRMQHNRLMDLVTKLSDRVVALETDLTQIKKVYGVAFTKLIKKVKRLEKKDKLSKSRRKLRLVLSDAEDEGITLVQMGVSTASIDFTISNVPVTTTGVEISTTSSEVKTAGDFVDDIAAESLVYIRRSVAKTKDKDEQLDQKREARGLTGAHEAARSFNLLRMIKTYKYRIETDEELAQRLQAEEREKYYEAEKARLLAELFKPKKGKIDFLPNKELITVPKIAAGSSKRVAEEELGQQSSKKQISDELSQEEIQQLMIIVPKEGMDIETLQTKYLIIDWEVYTDDLRMYWKIIRVEPTEDKEIEIWVELKRLFELDADDELWKSQKHIHDITLKLYDTCGVHHVSTKDGMDIYMLVEREYPLSRGVLTQMLVAKLLVEQNNEMSRELLRKIFMQA
ncbi:hypothetical protein Tco_1029519 [Tanacetum coccineum]|uniref:Uncharacterized protein n=1 Tax=Tanacetum coccineum TaxID=301880 RepID=A0ABQ5G4X1_9ASTR